jgi:IclR family pca regulon transcriptional regulator
MRDRNYLTSLDRGIHTLEVVGSSFRPLTLTEVANQMGMTKSSAQRFLNTLRSMGYLKRDENKRYALSPKILSLGFNFLNSSTIAKIVKPHIDHLSSTFNKTLNLAVLDGFEIVYLYRKEVNRFLKYDLQPGSRLPAYCTSAGKILLAGLSDEDFIARVSQNELKPVTPRTITSKDELLQDIRKTRARGYSICDRELSMDLYSMAFPLVNDRGDVVAAINVTMGLEEKKSPIMRDLVKTMANEAREISRILGYEGPYPPFPSETAEKNLGALPQSE